ncbi:MAG: hypothetical protein ACRDYC_13810, partial [Acidimicrobiales bacterium]
GVAAVVGSAVWAAQGPLQPGWARRAGTPARLLGGLPAPATGQTPSALAGHNPAVPATGQTPSAPTGQNPDGLAGSSEPTPDLVAGLAPAPGGSAVDGDG